MAESNRQKVKDLVERLNNDNNNNYYQKLGIKPGASRQEIKEAKVKIQDLLRGYQFDDNYDDYDDEWNEYESRDFMDDYNRSYGIVDDIVSELTTPSTKEDYDRKLEDEKSSSILYAITIDLIQIYKSIEKGLLSINNSINIVSYCTDWLTQSIVGLLKINNKSAPSGENQLITSPQQETIQSAPFMSQIPQETSSVRSDDLSARGYGSSAQEEINALNQMYNIIEQVNENQLTLQEQKEQQP